MRHAIKLGFVLLLLATGESHAAGNQPFCLQGLWTPTGNMSTPRVFPAATLLPGGKVLVAGGVVLSSFFDALATAELYDPTTGTWSPTGSMSTGRAAPTMTLLPSGKVLVVGGEGQSDFLASAELYDPATGQWQATGSLSNARAFHTATLLGSGKVLVVGGFEPPDVNLATAELYDPATGQWHATGATSVSRGSHTATLLASGQVLVAGGTSSAGLTSSAELYDPAAGTWTPVAPMLTARENHTATLLPSGAVLVAGGSDSSGSALTEVELYDPTSGTWRRTSSLSAPHARHTATRLPSGRILVVAGDANHILGNTTELFDPASETWSDAGCTVEDRYFHTATLLPSGAVLVAGGGGEPKGEGTSSTELYGIVVSPAQVSLASGASQTFTARGGSGFDYVWSFLQNKSGGTLTAAGVYQAGPVGGVTDVVQVVDSFANSATATVNVTKQASALSPTSSQASPVGCGTTGGAALPSLGGAVLVLLGWGSLRRRRRGRRTPAPEQAAS
jgi:N-acetylneuraminic acid mutarotase